MDTLEFLAWNVFANKFILYCLLSLICCFCYVVLKKWKLENKKYSWTKQFPTPRIRLPLLGNVHLCWGHATKVAVMFTKQTQKLGHIWVFWKFAKPTLIIADHEIAKQIFLSNNVDKHSDYDTVISSVLGKNGLITSPGAQWVHDRRYLQKAFHYEFFNEVFRISNEEGEFLISKITGKINEDNALPDMDKIFTECAAKITIRSQSKERGKLSPSHYDEILRCLDMGRELYHIYMYLGFVKHSVIGWLTGATKLERNFLRMTSHAVANMADSNSTQDERIINDSGRSDLWSLIFNPSKPFSWSKDQVVTLVSAATDTATISITMTLFYLAIHPECLDKAIEEIDLICPDQTLAELTLNDLSKLKYLEMCWKEAMRLHSPAPMVGRNLREEVILPDGRHLPVGADVYIMLTQIHRNPNLFEKPNNFIPERFDESNVKRILPGSYIPFSYGQRNCIGLKVAAIEAKVILAHVLWNFRVSTPQKIEDIKSLYMISSYPYPAIVLNFHPRR